MLISLLIRNSIVRNKTPKIEYLTPEKSYYIKKSPKEESPLKALTN